MASLMDCEGVTQLQPVDQSLVIEATYTGITLTEGGVQIPALRADWTPPASPWIVGIQFEYVDAEGQSVQSEIQLKDKANWITTSGLIAGGQYQVRHRATGAENKVYGDWTPYVSVVLPTAFTANDTENVGGTPASELILQLTTVTELVEQTAQAVSDLEEIYGDTVSAAQSAAEAALSAASAAAEAAIAEGKAEDSAASAVAASASADDANTSAVASASSASTASAAAIDAEESATAATAAKIAAETAKSSAESAATQAATSRDDAAGSAASASASATLAANSRDAAAGSASAAAGSASTATTAAGEAGVSAAAAQASQVSASTAASGALGAAIATIPDTIAADLWTDLGSSGAPPDRPSLAPSRVVGGAFVVPTGTTQSAGPKQRIRWVQGKVIEIRLRASVPSGTPAAYVRIGIARFDASYVNLNSNTLFPLTSVAPGASAEVTARIACGVTVAGATTINPGPEWLSLGCVPNLNAAGNGALAGAQMRITAFSVRDLTEQVNAAGSASAAATSASSASASETAAGQAATAASGSATNAATSAGQALAYSNQASTSSADAQAASVTAGVAASTAQLTSAKMMPDRPSEVGDFAAEGDPGVIRTPEQTSPMTRGETVATGDQGLVRQFNDATPSHATAVMSRGWKKIERGRSYRFTTTVRIVVAGDPANSFRQGFYLYKANGDPAGWWFDAAPAPTTSGWVTFSRTVTGDQLLNDWSEAMYLRPWVQSSINGNTGAPITGIAWQVSVLRAEDVTESASAANSAAVAQSASASATASAASAQISADLAVSVTNAGQNTLPNSTALLGMQGWHSVGNPTVGPDPSSPDGARFICFPAQGSTSDPSVFSDTFRWDAGATLSLSGEVIAVRMIGGFIRFYVEFRNDADAILGHAVSEHYGETPGWVKIKSEGHVPPAGTTRVRAVFDTWQASWGPNPVAAWRKLKVENSNTATPWNDQASSISLSAQLQITALTTADLATRMATASFEVTAAVGGNPAYLGIKADSSGSWAGIKAQALAFSNVVGGTVIEVMRIVGGAVYITGPLYIGSNKEIELNPISTHPHIAIKVGGGRMAMGKLPNDGLIYWFGPSQEVSDMRKSNATEWRDNTGQAYFKGGISTGTLMSSARTSDQNVPTSATTGRFGSLGKTITVNFNYDAEAYVASVNYTPPFPPSFEDISPASAVIRLHRSLNGGPFEAVASITVPGQVRNWGQNDGDSYSEGININCGGAGTYTDPDLSTLDRQYRVELVSRSFGWLNGPNNYRRQMLSVVCSEA